MPKGHWLRNYSTPVEVHDRYFQGLSLKCQMIFATWKEPFYERKDARHSMEELEQRRCPICKILQSSLLKHSEASPPKALAALHALAQYNTRSDVRLHKHVRDVLCYYIEVVFHLTGGTLKRVVEVYISDSEVNIIYNGELFQGKRIRYYNY